MAIKVIAQRREVKLGKNPGMKFVMRPDLYIPDSHHDHVVHGPRTTRVLTTTDLTD